ncbi:DUF3427 domain-containing protein [Marinilactibacillus piezotolerans]|uniref:DUF3427 domain-containing protein n=1 Tax=Marinilactibacillus piezotolerans TaxID=258723 RepID=UPI0009AF530C|nr:DEAD/DEAH box helicase [Marinilactibacillus piezotolerans]
MTDQLEQSLKKAFIDQTIQGSHFDPKIIINNDSQQQFMLNVLQEELETCQAFFFSVAFLTQDGLAALKTQLADLNRKGIKGRILTSVYLAFNQPEVFEDLLKIPNVEVKISSKKGFHSKGYLFKQAEYHSFIIGSSNLTMSALKINYEWNVRLTSCDHGEMIQEIGLHMEQEWLEAEALTVEWIEHYKQNYQKPVYIKELKRADSDTLIEFDGTYITPNKMQEEALVNLEQLRAAGARRGLVISATGTGKTYLSAFDVQKVRPKRVLFVVHREQILNKAKQDYQKVLGGKSEEYGILSGHRKETDAKYVFATIQTLSKESILTQFDPSHFDYILIDEVHKAGAESYHRVIDYFKPKFLLGMTATPERTDNFNIFELFDYNIAYEIRLQKALEADLIAPFNYFGVTDYEREGELITETTDLRYLVEEERVNYLIEKIKYYGCSGNIPKGLVFCSSRKEAELLSAEFSYRGIPSAYLAGTHSLTEREREIERLENGELQYIFTVDIFNEGIDIPKINQVVMLRNTLSSIIFIQQLGRGLRKHESKEFVNVIDFIGNYKNNYMIPMALSGDVSRNKNNLRKDTFDTHYISGVSTINFEEIAREQIYSSINQVAVDSMMELKKSYELLKNRLGRIPYLKDFEEQQTLDPALIAGKKHNYYEFLAAIKESEDELSKVESGYLTFVTRELLPGMRRHELVLMLKLINEPSRKFTVAELKQFFYDCGLLNDEEMIHSVIRTLDLSFFTGQEAKVYSGLELIQFKDGEVELTSKFKEALKKETFIKLIKDTLITGKLKSKQFDQTTPLTRFQKYRRKDVIRLLKWEQQMINQNIGGYTDFKDQFVIFVTLEKGDDFAGAQMAYEDELLDVSTMKWFTKSPRTLNSPEVIKLKKPDDYDIHVFVKKSDDEGSDFYYLGEVKPKLETITQLEKPDKKGNMKNVVEMQLKFLEPIETKLYRYLQYRS